jgi:hypothetical protein
MFETCFAVMLFLAWKQMMTLEFEHLQDEMPSLWEEGSVSEAESETVNNLLHFSGTDQTTHRNEMLHVIQMNL